MLAVRRLRVYVRLDLADLRAIVVCSRHVSAVVLPGLVPAAQHGLCDHGPALRVAEYGTVLLHSRVEQYGPHHPHIRDRERWIAENDPVLRCKVILDRVHRTAGTLTGRCPAEDGP